MSEQNPWKTLGSREIYANPWLALREDQVIRPDGKQGIYGVITTRIATGVVALSRDQQVYLVGQYRYPTQRYSWEIVEGGSDPGEDALTTARRELQEEAGLLARTWTPLGGEIHLSNCISAERGFLFLAEDLEWTTASPDGTEVLEVIQKPLGDCLAMVHSGEITDALTILGLLLTERVLDRRGS